MIMLISFTRLTVCLSIKCSARVDIDLNYILCKKLLLQMPLSLCIAFDHANHVDENDETSF